VPFGRGTVAAVTYLFLFAFIGLGAVLALVAALAALGAYLRYRQARAELQENLTSEVERLSQRTGELERGLISLQERSARLPISISGLQQNLSTLQVLTGALAASLAQAQTLLSYSVRETVDATPLGRLLPPREARRTS
jgi:septal ring factor EnvC (AmiA/AmiB activator)